MRILLTLALTLVLVSLATIAAAPVTRVANASNVATPSPDAKNTGAQDTAPTIDSSKARFVLIVCNVDSIDKVRRVFGVVAKEIDLSQDSIAKQILEQAARFAQDRCPVSLGRDRGGRATGQFEYIDVMLSRGDPTTLTDDFDKRDRAEDPFQVPRERMLKAAYRDAVVYAENLNPERLTWWRYENRASSARKEAERIALANEKERQRQQVIAQQMEADRAAARRAQAEIAARSAAFLRTNNVKHFVSIEQLTANPFVYKGQVVALYAVFEQMTSATQGLFSSADKRFVVSGIPTARFTQRRSMAILAGRVLGNIERGSMLVPHLSFVGNAFCHYRACSEYAFNLR